MGKQLKLNELKRVVNVDKFSEYAAILADSTKFNQNEKQIEKVLDELAKKTPSRDILKSTKLGHILKEVSDRDCLTRPIRSKARRLREQWKEFHKRLLQAPRYDVKCDKPTNEARTRARQSLTSCLLVSTDRNSKETESKSHDSVHQLIRDIEFKVFQSGGNLVNVDYFNLIRKCIKELNNESTKISLRQKLLNGMLTVDEFVKNALKS